MRGEKVKGGAALGGSTVLLVSAGSAEALLRIGASGVLTSTLRLAKYYFVYLNLYNTLADNGPMYSPYQKLRILILYVLNRKGEQTFNILLMAITGEPGKLAALVLYTDCV